MANTTSAQKQVRVAQRKKLRNKSVRSLCKTKITRAEKLIFSGETEAARKEVSSAVSALSKAAEKGIIHPNNAARRKSRLMRKLSKPAAPPAAKAAGEAAPK